MAAMSVSQNGQAGKTVPALRGKRVESAVLSVGQSHSTTQRAGTRFFDSLLKEYNGQISSRDQDRFKQKKEGSSSAKDVVREQATFLPKKDDAGRDSAHNISNNEASAARSSTEHPFERRTQQGSQSSSSVKEDSEEVHSEKAESDEAPHQQQDWMLQYMMTFSPLLPDQQSSSQGGTEALATTQQGSKESPIGTTSNNEGAENTTTSDFLATTNDDKQSDTALQLQSSLHSLPSSEKAGAEPVSLKEDMGTVATASPQPLPQQPLPQQPISQLNEQNTPRFSGDHSNASMADMEGQVTSQPASVQLSDVSVVSHNKSEVEQDRPHSSSQSVQVDSASYLNVQDDALYANPSVQAVSTTEQVHAQKLNDRDSFKATSVDKNDQSLEASSSIASTNMKETDVRAAQASQDDSNSFGQSAQNGQEHELLSNSDAQEPVATNNTSSGMTAAASFQGMLNGNSATTNEEGRAFQGGEVLSDRSLDATEIGIDGAYQATPVVQKRLSDPSSTLGMTLKTSDSTPVRVQVTRLPEGVAAVSLQGEDEATTKALTKSRHELLEQLHAAGIHATSIKIDVLPADLSGMNGEHTHDHFGQNTSSGGQSGQGGDTSHEEQRQKGDASGAVSSLTGEDIRPRGASESIIAHLGMPQSVAGGGLNISV